MRENRRRYGTRRIKAALQQSGVKLGRLQIRRIMREQNLKAIQPKSFKPKTTDSKGTSASPNLLAEVKSRDCAAGKIIVGDITYLPLKNGKWCYLAVWQDKVTRKNNRVEFIRNNDGGIDHFSLEKSCLERVGSSRSNYPYGSWEPICGKAVSPAFTAELFSSINERKRQLLR
jgi:hypothetical protein